MSFVAYLCTLGNKSPPSPRPSLAYRYLEKEEPELLARQTELKPLPDYRSVELLRQAREEKDFSEEEYAELRRAVMEDERSHPTVMKRFKEVAATHSDEPADLLIPLKNALAAARRLETALKPIGELPEEHREGLERLLTHLEQEIEAASSPA